MLEQAAACPFAFFAEYALHLQPREEPDYDVSPLVLGELAHDILAEFFTHTLPRDSRAAVQRMQVIAARVLDRHGRGPGLGHPGFWQVRKAELLRALADVAAHAAQWAADDYRTLYHEHSLRGEVPCGGWSLQLKGRVDRVAIREGPSGIHSLQVQDFKYSGNIDRYRGLLKLDALGQTSFQLPVYLYLALQQLEQDGHRVAPDAELLLEYLLLKDPGQKAWGIAVSHAFLSPDHPGGLLHGIRRVTEEAIGGRFTPRPAEGKQTCTYCAYAALCRYWTSGAGMDVEAGIEASGQQGIE